MTEPLLSPSHSSSLSLTCSLSFNPLGLPRAPVLYVAMTESKGECCCSSFSISLPLLPYCSHCQLLSRAIPHQALASVPSYSMAVVVRGCRGPVAHAMVTPVIVLREPELGHRRTSPPLTSPSSTLACPIADTHRGAPPPRHHPSQGRTMSARCRGAALCRLPCHRRVWPPCRAPPRSVPWLGWA